MKPSVLILSICLLCLSFSASAQKYIGEERVQPRSISFPNKGYYAIGNNAAKLYTPANVQVFTGLRTTKNKTSTDVRKGYYATGKNKAKLPAQTVLEEVNPAGKANVIEKPAKGYYSIGRNAEKLQK